jgi:hypothetical protein
MLNFHCLSMTLGEHFCVLGSQFLPWPVNRECDNSWPSKPYCRTIVVSHRTRPRRKIYHQVSIVGDLDNWLWFYCHSRLLSLHLDSQPYLDILLWIRILPETLNFFMRILLSLQMEGRWFFSGVILFLKYKYNTKWMNNFQKVKMCCLKRV